MSSGAQNNLYEKVEGDRARRNLTRRDVEAIVVIHLEAWHEIDAKYESFSVWQRMLEHTVWKILGGAGHRVDVMTVYVVRLNDRDAIIQEWLKRRNQSENTFSILCGKDLAISAKTLANEISINDSEGSLLYVYISDDPNSTASPLWSDIYRLKPFDAAHHVNLPQPPKRLSQKARGEQMGQIYRSLPDPSGYFYYQRYREEDQSGQAQASASGDSTKKATAEKNTATDIPENQAERKGHTVGSTKDKSEGFLHFLERAASVYDKF